MKNKIKCFGRFDDRDKVCYLCKELNSMTYHECVAVRGNLRDLGKLKVVKEHK